ncbi:MAG: hypothetical protein CMF62_00380 [Magnetococcales bacterium]|nr:hypothetical protein [Magnetococcales bacterium]|tara:strand:- start:23125 stop:23517 length:393 start_codon:yes stop_codon:yes gene_type:complete
MDILKNPIVIGILALVITYAYLWWENEQKYKKNPEIKKKSVNLMIPGVVGAVSWFIASSYFDKNSSTPEKNKILAINSEVVKPTLRKELEKALSEASDIPDSFKSGSYKALDNESIKVPDLDVFMDLMSM